MDEEHRKEINALKGKLIVIHLELDQLNEDLAPGVLISDPGWRTEASRRRAHLEAREEAILNRIYKINWLYEGV